MLPDTGERYLSTPLFEGITEDMTDEEQDIARSTPNYRFDSPPPAPPADEQEEAAPAPLVVEDSAREFLQDATHDAPHSETA